jgi:5-methylcytosine-specific restriction endonuclease McrA
MATHQRWYDSARWRRKSKAWLALEPLCVMCKARGLTTAATVADHVVAHRSNARLFWDGELQALCRRCHREPNNRSKLRDTRARSAATAGQLTQITR